MELFDIVRNNFALVIANPSAYLLHCLMFNLLIAIISWSIFVRRARRNAETPEPPVYTHLVPWIGHAFSLATNITAFAARVRNSCPNDTINEVLIAGQKLYLIFDAKAVKQIHRQTKMFSFDPFLLMVLRALGSTKEDMKVFQLGAHVTGQNTADSTDRERGILHDMHYMHNSHLSGKALEVLTSKFMEILVASIDEQFPADNDQWQTLDICGFILKTWTMAASKSFLGTKLFEDWPDFFDLFWTFDDNFNSLLKEWPRWLNCKAWENRDNLMSHLIAWEARAFEAEKDGVITGDSDWDPYWGMRYCREASKFMISKGLCEQGRNVAALSFLWGLNANAVPIGTMAIIHAATDKKLMQNLLAEIHAAQTGPTTFDMNKITSQSPRLKSLFLEVLRWGTAFSSPRMVTEKTSVNGYILKQNSMLLIPARVLHHDKQVWETDDEKPVEQFDAERFLDPEYRNENIISKDGLETDSKDDGMTSTATPKQIDPLSGPKSKAIRQKMQSFRPFGGGLNLCPGRFFATNEILGGLAALLMRLEIEVVEEDLKARGMPKPDLSRAKQGGLLPDRPLMVKMRRRAT